MRPTYDPLWVASRIAFELLGIVVVVGLPSSRRFPGMGFDELALVENAYERLVASDGDLLADVARWDRVQRLEELHVMIGVNLGLGPMRRVESLPTHRSKARLLDLLEHEHGSLPSGSVDASSRNLSAPLPSLSLHMFEVEPLLAAKETFSSIANSTFDDRLALRMASDRRVDDEASVLGVLAHYTLKHRLVAIRFHHCRFHVVDHHSLRYTAEKLPGMLEPVDHHLQLLRKADVKVLVATEAECDQQSPHDSIPARLLVVHLAESTKIHLGELSR